MKRLSACMHNFVQMEKMADESMASQQAGNKSTKAFFRHSIYAKPAFLFLRKPVITIALLFIFSRAIAYLLGVYFDTGFFRWGPQCLDIPLLQNKLWESIWYMHGQPPLFNLYIASVINIFPPQYVNYIFLFCFLALGLLHAVLLYKLLGELHIPGKINMAVTLYFMLSPGAILYENLFYYTQIELFILTLSAWLLVKFIKLRLFKYGFLFFLSLAILILTRSMFHWFWLLGIVVILMLMMPDLRRKIFLACIIPVILSGGWYFKNYVLYGRFASSTWMGMSLANVVQPTEGIAQKQRWKGIEEYKYFIVPDNRYPNIEVLHTPYQSDSMINMNYLPYLQVFDQFLDASVNKIKSEPLSYFQNVFKAHILFFGPASNYAGLSNNRETIKIYATLYDFSFVNALYKRLTGNNLYDPAAYIAVINLLVFFLAARFCFKWRSNKSVEKRLQFLTMIFLLYNIAYIDFAGNFFEYSENIRFRVITIPSILVLAAVLLKYYEPMLKKLFFSLRTKNTKLNRQNML